MQEPGAYSLLLRLCNYREAEELGHYRWRYAASQFFPCAWYWGVGKKGRAVRWSGCPTSKQQAILSSWVMHIFFFFILCYRLWQ